MAFGMSPFPLRFGSQQGGGGASNIVYQDEFGADTSGEWQRGVNSVDGTITVAGGDLVYTKGAGDGSTPRITREIAGLVAGAAYRYTYAGLGGTSTTKLFDLSPNANGTSPFVALTSASASALFRAPGTTLYPVLRIATGSAGQTARISSILIERVPEVKFLDNFSFDTSANLGRGADSVDGTIVVTGGKLVYTKGAGDGTNPRIAYPITGLTIGRSYTYTYTGLGGSATTKALDFSANSNGTGAFEASTAASGSDTFAAPASTIYAVLRIASGSAGQTAELDSLMLEDA